MTCEVTQCRQEEEVLYLEHWLCDKHWAQKSNGQKLKVKNNKVI